MPLARDNASPGQAVPPLSRTAPALGIDIAIPDGVSAGGWVSLSGTLPRSGGGYGALLYCDTGTGFDDGLVLEIPTAVNGNINELIELPPGVARLQLRPLCEVGESQADPLRVTKVGIIARTWRMMYRVISTIRHYPGERRAAIRLNLTTMLCDLADAYRAASKLRAYAVAPRYEDWIAQFDTLQAGDLKQIKGHIARFASRPFFHVLVVSDGANRDALLKTLESLDGQLYRDFSCVLLEMGERHREAAVPGGAQGVTRVEFAGQSAWLEQFNSMLATRHDGWVMLLRAGDVLAPHALYRFACMALDKPAAVMMYSDDDELASDGQRYGHRFKPDWSLAHFRSTHFVGDAVAIRGNWVHAAGGIGAECIRHGNYDLLLRVIDAAGAAGEGNMIHVPGVLMHGMHGSSQESGGLAEWNAPDWNMRALRAHLQRNGLDAEVVGTIPGCWRVRFRLPDELPLVSIIVPTRDEVATLKQCLDTLFARTTYPAFEVLVLDNQSADPEALDYLARISARENVRVLRYDLPFNFSAMNNMAVAEARGEVVCLLNNDTEVISPDWLEEMVGHLFQHKAGVVGAKLYYPGGLVQHGGDLVGVGGVANHAHALLPPGELGYCNRAMVVQELSAVTGACLLTFKNLYQKLGGLDERLPVAFNDVDYCLRVRESGCQVVWTPHAELYHHESISRGKDIGAEKVQRAKLEAAFMRKRWRQVLQHDRFYNPNLSYERPDFSLSHAPVVAKPWLD